MRRIPIWEGMRRNSFLPYFSWVFSFDFNSARAFSCSRSIEIRIVSKGQGLENETPASHNEGVKAMQDDRQDVVLITQEACDYLRISRPTYLKYLYIGKIKGARAGKGWRVLKSELERFLKGDNEK